MLDTSKLVIHPRYQQHPSSTLVYQFIPQSTHPSTSSSIYSLVNSLLCFLILPFILPFIHLPIHLPVCSVIYSSIHPFIDRHIRALIHQFVNPPTHPSIHIVVTQSRAIATSKQSNVRFQKTDPTKVPLTIQCAKDLEQQPTGIGQHVAVNNQ